MPAVRRDVRREGCRCRPQRIGVLVAGAGVASLDGEDEWVLLDIAELPEGNGPGDGWPGRVVDQITIGPDGTVWLAGEATSDADDEEFGGILNGWFGGRTLWWVARGEGCEGPSCDWVSWTSNDVPELAGKIGDIVVAGDGTFYAAVGENSLLEYRDQVWTSHTVPGLPTGWNGLLSPWSFSLTVGVDGVLWAGTNLDSPGRGVFAFNGDSFTRFTTSDRLPGDMVPFVEAAADGTIWAATDALYGNPHTAAPDTDPHPAHLHRRWPCIVAASMSELHPVETTAEDATRLMDLLAGEAIEWWVAGGWGIDALIGYQTRPHRDLDVLIPVPQVLTVHRLLLADGFSVEGNWFPTRFQMVHPDGRAVDVHPIRLDSNGGGRLELSGEDWWTCDAEALSGRGTIGSRATRCLTVTEQFRCHTGYEPTEIDRADMNLLSTHFNVEIPPQYR